MSLDRKAAEAVMALHPDGARLVLRTEEGRTYSDVACSIGFQWGPTPVFAYLAAGQGPPFSADTKFFVEGVARRTNACVVTCRSERRVCEIEIHVLIEAERDAVRRWLASMPSDVIEYMENVMRSMLDPRSL